MTNPATAVATKADLDSSARVLLSFLALNRDEASFDYPLHDTFPANGCEYVSLILIHLLVEKYGLANARFIRGRSERGEMHFWVMVGHLHYDLTVQQFEGQAPVIGSMDHDFMSREFPDWSVVAVNDLIDRPEVVALYRQGIIPF